MLFSLRYAKVKRGGSQSILMILCEPPRFTFAYLSEKFIYKLLVIKQIHS